MTIYEPREKTEAWQRNIEALTKAAQLVAWFEDGEQGPDAWAAIRWLDASVFANSAGMALGWFRGIELLRDGKVIARWRVAR